ncbi:hypothetical protein [Pseudoxanthomonas sp. UTMC 1351]|uniref:hypothetical protein n=1 Tax=Pseudoxanthomonas sp. UTMC 1351 TaxID=2695853 RepID=UPI0034CF9F15
MTNVFALRSLREPRLSAAPARPAGVKTKAEAKLAALLRDACHQDGAILHPLLAKLLAAHMRSHHLDASANGEIRDVLDEIQLMVCLEIERQGLRYGDESIPSCQPSSFART